MAGADGEPYQSASPLNGRRPVPPRGCRRGAHHDRTGRRGPAQGVFRHLIGGTEHTGLNGDESDPTKGPETGVGAKVTGNLGDMSLSAGGDVVLTGAPCVAERHFSTSASIQTQKTAWHLPHRIRENWDDQHRAFAGPVGLDAACFGGRERNKHASQHLHAGRGARCEHLR